MVAGGVGVPTRSNAVVAMAVTGAQCVGRHQGIIAGQFVWREANPRGDRGDVIATPRNGHLIIGVRNHAAIIRGGAPLSGRSRRFRGVQNAIAIAKIPVKGPSCPAAN